MKLRMVILATIVLSIGMAPAELVDKLFSLVSNGRVRVASSNGSVWSGGGLLSVADVGGERRWRPWTRINWSFDPFGLFRGRLRWRIILGDEDPAIASAGLMDWEVVGLSLHGPANNFLQRVPGQLGNLRWDGSISVSIQDFQCSWRLVCNGKLAARWRNAGSDFLPGQEFGSYEVLVTGIQGKFGLNWTSAKESYVRTEGSGEVSAQEGLRLQGSITGDKDLLARLPAIAGPWARPTAAPGTWQIHYP